MDLSVKCNVEDRIMTDIEGEGKARLQKIASGDLNDVNESLITSRVKKWSKRFIDYFELPTEESASLGRALRQQSEAYSLNSSTSIDTLLRAAQELSADLANHSPSLSAFIERGLENKSMDALYVSKLPIYEMVPQLLPLVISTQMGCPMNYSCLKGNDLVYERFGAMQPRIRHKNLKMLSNSSEAFTLFSSFPRDCRPEWALSFGVANPKGIESYYIPFLNVYDYLTIEARRTLMSFRVSFPVPRMYGYKQQRFISYGPLLRITDDRRIEINLPQSLSQVHMLKHSSLTEAFQELNKVIRSKVKRFVIRPGSFLAVNNYRGFHMRRKEEGPDFMILRTFVINNLKKVRGLTGQEGPVFDPQKVLDHHVIPE